MSQKLSRIYLQSSGMWSTDQMYTFEPLQMDPQQNKNNFGWEKMIEAKKKDCKITAQIWSGKKCMLFNMKRLSL